MGIKKGATPILIFSGIMRADFYCEEILAKTLLPFIKNVYLESHRFMQDNDSKHTNNKAKQWFVDNDIFWWKTPPESPDMNPIENLWHELKHYLRSEVKPRNKAELIDGIQSKWKQITVEKCNRYIDHLKKVLPKVVERNGKASGF